MLLTTSATQVRELEVSVNSTFRQLSSPDPEVELTRITTAGAGSPAEQVHQ